MNKAELRKIYSEKRKGLSQAEYTQYNLQLSHLFFLHADLSSIKVLHTYLPIEKNNEPDTWAIINRLQREFTHIRISIPKINTVTNELENFYFEGVHQIGINSWGIPEPKQGIPTPSEKIDMILVPLLAFDEKGERVGYGRGYYDRFFTQCKTHCQKIGLSFFEPVDSITDVSPFDIRLNQCITPSEVKVFDR